MKKKNNVLRVEPDIGRRTTEETFREIISGVASFILLVGFIFILGCVCGRFVESRKSAAQSNEAFTIEGAVHVNTEIDGETHRFVCYQVDVSDFWLSQDPDKAELIGEDEAFTKFIQPDGTVAYYATYYEQLDENRGIKVRKEFMDCGADNEFLAAGHDVPLVIMFSPSTGYYAGIMDAYDKHRIPTVTFD